MTTNTHTILCLDLGTKTGWAICGADGRITSDTEDFQSRRFEGGGCVTCALRDGLLN